MNIETLVVASNPCAATAALRIVSVRARERGRGRLDACGLSDAFERQRDLIAALCASRAGRAFELRTIVLPEPGASRRGTIFLFLLARAEGETTEQACAAVREAIEEAAAAFHGLGDVYDVEPVRTSAELCFAREPFPVRHMAEVTRREATLEPGSLMWRKARPLGFSAGSHGHEPPEVLHHTYSWVPRERSLCELYQVLLAQPSALLLSVQLAPLILSPEQLATQRDTLARAERWLDAYDGADTGREARASRTAVQMLLQEKSSQHARLEDGSYAVRMRIASAAPLRESAIEAVAQAISAPVGASTTPSGQSLRGGANWNLLTGESLVLAGQELATLSVTPRESALIGGPEGSLGGAFDLFEAQSAFRLPVPDNDALPGLATRFARFASVPRGVPAMGARLGLGTDPGIPQEIRIQTDDRRRHCYVVGQSGTGKSTLFCSMILEDIRNGSGVCVIDPHGDLIDEIMLRYPKERADDLVLFDAGDRERPIGLNPLEWSTSEEKTFLVQELVAMMYRLFSADMIGPMFERTLRNCLLTLMSLPDGQQGTLLEVPRLFMDREFHKKYLPHVSEPHVRAFWTEEFAKMTDHHRGEFLGYFVSKLERFVSDPVMSNIVGQEHSAIRFDEIMNQGKVLLVDLGKGSIGDMNSALLGMTIVAKLQAAAMSRAQQRQDERRDFYLYVDEFQNFASATFSTLLSEARKFRLNLILTNQYTGQLSSKQMGDDVLSAVLGNVGTLIALRVGVEDAPLLTKHFTPTFEEADLTNLPSWHAYVSLLVDGQRLRPFSMRTLADDGPTSDRLAAALRQLSRLKFGRDQLLVERDIANRWL